MSGDGRRLMSDKVRSRNSNNSKTWYYDLSIILYLGGVLHFEAKKAINHEIEAYGYGGGEEEDEDGVCVCVCVFGVNEGEKMRAL